MKENKLLSKYQSGSRRIFLWEAAVCRKSLEEYEKNKILAIFLNFRRAFEKIVRDILLQKLIKYGIENKELMWFRSYLTNRKQITRVNNTESSPIENRYEVPQGSILEELLHIIYINDMEKAVEKCEVVLYADDTLIFTADKHDNLRNENLSKDMENINKWLMMNKLKLKMRIKLNY